MTAPRDMLGFAEALAEVDDRSWVGPAENVPVTQATGRRLAEAARAVVPAPPFTNSAMDGWAVRAADGGSPRREVGEARAGAPWIGKASTGEAVRISTGAAVPPGCDAVVPRERVEVVGEEIRVQGQIRLGDHVRPLGGDIAIGDVLLAAGHRIGAHELATLGGGGLADVPCHPRPRVALLLSGDELRPLGAQLGPGEIHDSIRPALSAQILARGGKLVATEAVGDDRAATESAVTRLLDGADVLITTGGVSVGPHDHLGPAFVAAGVERIFWGVRVRPGSPLWFGVRGSQRVLGLPGNPVSAIVGMEVFGAALLGAAPTWGRLAPLAQAYPRATPRAELVRCRWHGGSLMPLPRQASHAVTSLVADALGLVPEGEDDLAAGASLAWIPLGSSA